MAKGDYYFKLFYKRLLTSTIGWKDDEFGAYMRLLIHQFDNDNRIPNDLDELQLIAPSIKKNWKRIGKKFKDDGNGMLYNEVMSDEYSDVQNKKQIRSEFGKLGGRPKKQKVNQTETKEKPKAFDLLNQNESYPITNNQKPKEEEIVFTIEHCLVVALNDGRWVYANKANENDLKEFNALLERRGIYNKNPLDYKNHFANWKLSGKKDEAVKKEEPQPNSSYRFKKISA